MALMQISRKKSVQRGHDCACIYYCCRQESTFNCKIFKDFL